MEILENVIAGASAHVDLEIKYASRNSVKLIRVSSISLISTNEWQAVKLSVIKGLVSRVALLIGQTACQVFFRARDAVPLENPGGNTTSEL